MNKIGITHFDLEDYVPVIGLQSDPRPIISFRCTNKELLARPNKAAWIMLLAKLADPVDPKNDRGFTYKIDKKQKSVVFYFSHDRKIAPFTVALVQPRNIKQLGRAMVQAGMSEGKYLISQVNLGGDELSYALFEKVQDMKK